MGKGPKESQDRKKSREAVSSQGEQSVAARHRAPRGEEGCGLPYWPLRKVVLTPGGEAGLLNLELGHLGESSERCRSVQEQKDNPTKPGKG